MSQTEVPRSRMVAKLGHMEDVTPDRSDIDPDISDGQQIAIHVDGHLEHTRVCELFRLGYSLNGVNGSGLAWVIPTRRL